jgi:hypothetical protein
VTVRSPDLQLLGPTYRPDLSEFRASFVLWPKGGTQGDRECGAGLPELHVHGELLTPPAAERDRLVVELSVREGRVE